MKISETVLKVFRFVYYSLFILTLLFVLYSVIQISSRMNKPSAERLLRHTAEISIKTGAYINYPVFFYFSKDVTMAMCHSIIGYPLYVQVNTYHWKRLNSQERLILIYHEVGHCSFNIVRHDDRKFKDGCPSSLMASYFPSKKCLTRYGYHYYINKFLEDIK